MRNQNTKGFTLLELLVVVAIIGAIAAAGIPSFLNWSADRKVRKANDQIAGLITRLNTQTQRGVYPFTQLLITPQDQGLSIQGRGKNKSSINTLVNAGNDLTCEINDPTYWDEVVSTFTINDIFVHFANDSAVCFSKNADNYLVEGDITDNNLNPLETNETNNIVNYLIVCNSENDCDTEPEMPAYMMVWSRFGNVSKFKYNSSDEWIRQ